jgi:N6-adenosine-specific RNA methylase IME4
MAGRLAKRDHRDIQLAGFTLTAVGVEVTGKPSIEDWRSAVQFIDRAASASMWWHGDMLNFGHATYGELASQEDGDGKYERASLMQAKWVAAQLPFSMRIEKLSFTHHALIASLPPAQQKKWLAKADRDGLSVADLRKELRNDRLQIAAAQPIPEGQYRILYADPPWKYNDELIEGYGAAEHHYPTLTIGELCELPVSDMATSDAVLFLWATSPLLDDAFRVISAWGFEYKTSFVWDKVKHNYGHYNSVRHELLLISTRGSCVPDSDTLRDSVVECPRGEHSEKPDVFYEIIEEMYHRGPRLELFARRKRKGWKAWGNEC